MDFLLAREVFKEFHLVKPDQLNIHRNEGRLIAEIIVDSEIYFLKGERQSVDFVRCILSFVAEMKDGGIPFPSFKKTLTGQQFVEAQDMIFTLEKKADGIEVEQLQLGHISEIGKMLGRQHAISATAKTHFGTGTSWGMFGGNQSDALGDYDENELSYQEFICEAEKMEDFLHEVQLIKDRYATKRERLRKVWGILPTGPVQGDFCQYNMLFSEDGHIVSIYDFNIAGDEVLLNECIGVGVFLCWHSPYAGDETKEQRFQTFMTAYKRERPFTEAEDNYFNDLFSIIRAFRYDRVAKGIDSVQRKVGGRDFLQETLQLLNG